MLNKGHSTTLWPLYVYVHTYIREHTCKEMLSHPQTHGHNKLIHIAASKENKHKKKERHVVIRELNSRFYQLLLSDTESYIQNNV